MNEPEKNKCKTSNLMSHLYIVSTSKDFFSVEILKIKKKNDRVFWYTVNSHPDRHTNAQDRFLKRFHLYSFYSKKVSGNEGEIKSKEGKRMPKGIILHSNLGLVNSVGERKWRRLWKFRHPFRHTAQVPSDCATM